MRQLDTENADRDLTAIVTVLTHTPDASNPCMCQGLILFGDGAKNLDGTGGAFELTITVGGQTVEPNPQTVTFSTAVRTSVFTTTFPVPANAEVILRVKSPNVGDADVDVTAYLFDVGPVQPSTRGRPLAVDANARVDIGSWLSQAVTLSTNNKPDVNVDEWKDVLLATTNPLPNAVAGAASGLLIAGSNAATTFATLTVSGATTLTGNVSLGGTLRVEGVTTLVGGLDTRITYPAGAAVEVITTLDDALRLLLARQS